MTKQDEHSPGLASMSSDYILNPFAPRLAPLIHEVLKAEGKDHDRKGTKLVGTFVVWLVLGMTMRRDLNADAVLNWLISGWRWLSQYLPKTVVASGAITHARTRVGKGVFKALFERVVATFKPIEPDFNGWVSVAFDGSTGSMPDTPANCQHYPKANSRRAGEPSGYPHLRWMSLLAIGPRLLLDVAQGAAKGKGTGEQTLMMQILERVKRKQLLFLADAGLYSLLMMYRIEQMECAYLLKVNANLKLAVTQRLVDGSYLSTKTVKVPAPSRSPSKRTRWEKKTSPFASLSIRFRAFALPA